MEFKGSNIVSISQFNKEDISRIFEVAKKMEKYSNRQKKTTVLNGAVMANLFFEPSTRSRISFSSAFCRLGGSVDSTTGFSFSSISKGESLYDTGRVVSGYADVIVIRHPDKGAVAKFAEATNIPIINGGDGIGEHPTQALLDFYTLVKERFSSDTKNMKNVTIALVGDLAYGRTVHSLAKLLALYDNITFTLVSPKRLKIPEYIIDILRKNKHTIHETENLIEGISGADVIYTTRVQEERFDHITEYQKYRGIYSLNREIYEKHCKQNAIIMHPLPRDSRNFSNELDIDLNHHPNLAIFRQTDNGIPIRMALFAMVLGVDGIIDDYQVETNWYVPDSIDRKL